MRYVPLLLFLVLFCLSSCGPSKVQLKEESSVHYGLGVVHLNEGNIPEALKELTTAVEKYPDDATYHNALGLAFFARELNHDAIGHFKRAIEIKKDFSDAHTNLSAVYIQEGKWDDAISEANEALANIFYSTPAFAYFNRGTGYYEKAEYREAAADFERAVKANTNYALAYYNLGLAYRKLDRYSDAKKALSTFIQFLPNRIDGHYNLGLAYLKLKEPEQAKKAFSEVIRLAPDGELARSSRGYLDLLR
jgi:type IV pilus assembly protein PilF